jgi:hypothetical protein
MDLTIGAYQNEDSTNQKANLQSLTNWKVIEVTNNPEDVFRAYKELERKVSLNWNEIQQ